jgi:hypothetical protein
MEGHLPQRRGSIECKSRGHVGVVSSFGGEVIKTAQDIASRSPDGSGKEQRKIDE